MEVRQERIQSNIPHVTQDTDTSAIEMDRCNTIDCTIKDPIDANIVTYDGRIYNREENNTMQLVYENESQEAVSSIQNADTTKKGVLAGRTVTHVAFAITLSVLAILYEPQISNALKTTMPKKCSGTNQDVANAVS